MYTFRLDDASEYMDVEKWNRIEQLFDKYSVKPIVGIIPHNEDQSLVTKYEKDNGFWDKARSWKEKDWRIALHGYNHVFTTRDGGLNPVNKKSEFAGVSLENQEKKLEGGYQILCDAGLEPDMFFAPAHTYDLNTLVALKEKTSIRIISDTIANDTYFEDGFYYVPQQIGKARKAPFNVTTICLHPNELTNEYYDYLKTFVAKNQKKIMSANDIKIKDRKLSVWDRTIRFVFQTMRKIKR